MNRNIAVEPSHKMEKILFFHKKMAEDNKFIKRNTKNIPKNFCKAFISFMEGFERKKTERWTTAMDDYNKLVAKNKYNNILIQKMLSSLAIAPFFKQFL